MEEVPTTFLCATKRASWSLPSLVRALSWIPWTSEPVDGVSSLTDVAPRSNSGKLGSASLPCS